MVRIHAEGVDFFTGQRTGGNRMNIEVGKAYRTRDGRKFFIDKFDNKDKYPFKDKDGLSWLSSGKYSMEVPEHDFDLIAPWQEEPQPELKIEAGKFYQLRNGKKARVDATDYSGAYPNRGGVFYETGLSVCSWMPDGKVRGDRYESNEDIIAPWIDPPKPLECFVNIYSDLSGKERLGGTAYDTEPQAKEGCYGGNMSYLRTSKFVEQL